VLQKIFFYLMQTLLRAADNWCWGKSGHWRDSIWFLSTPAQPAVCRCWGFWHKEMHCVCCQVFHEQTVACSLVQRCRGIDVAFAL